MSIAARARWTLIAIPVLAYLADFGQMKLRSAHGTAFGAVVVHRFLTTPLKGHKEEYDYIGDESVPCSRSLFPQAQSQPCWWVARHTTVWE